MTTRKWFAVLVCLTVITRSDAQAFIYKKEFKPTACDSLASLNPGEIKKTTDDDALYWDKAFVPAMSKRTDAVLELVKKTFPGVKGFVAEYERGMSKGTFIKDGSRCYSFQFPFFPYGCIYDKKKDASNKWVEEPTGKFGLSSETGTWLYFYFNYPSSFFGGGKSITIDGKPHKVYETKPIAGTWKGVDIYGSPEFLSGEAWSTEANIWLMLTRKNDPAFAPITRRQYLEIISGEYDEQHAKNISGLGTSDNDRAVLKHYNDQYAADTKNIADYISTAPADSLNQPAVVFATNTTYPCAEWFNPRIRHSAPSRYFIAKHEYWHLDEDKAAPQIIVMRFRYDMGNWNDTQVKKQFEANFPLDQLQALLDK